MRLTCDAEVDALKRFGDPDVYREVILEDLALMKPTG
jgi:hypothetical protein